MIDYEHNQLHRLLCSVITAMKIQLGKTFSFLVSWEEEGVRREVGSDKANGGNEWWLFINHRFINRHVATFTFCIIDKAALNTNKQRQWQWRAGARRTWGWIVTFNWLFVKTWVETLNVGYTCQDQRYLNCSVLMKDVNHPTFMEASLVLYFFDHLSEPTSLE